MLCFRDKSFCSAGDNCKNRRDCPHWFGPEQKAAAEKWWQGMKGEPPVAFIDFSPNCADWSPILLPTPRKEEA